MRGGVTRARMTSKNADAFVSRLSVPRREFASSRRGHFSATMTEVPPPLSERFSQCSFTPITKSVAPFSPIIASAEGAWSATSFYLDSSGRSRFLLPLQLACRTKDEIDRLLASKCLQPPPKNVEQEDIEQDIHVSSTFSLRLEAQCHNFDEEDDRGPVTIESITILSTTVEGNSIILDTEVIVRASSQVSELKGGTQSGVIDTRLAVTAVLADRSKQQRPLASGLVALELGGGNLPFSGLAKTALNSRDKQARLGPLSIDLSMTSALLLSSKSVGGTSNGSTMVSLTMKHSNTHPEPVTITNIALHPGHSRKDFLSLRDRSMPGGERSVVDMSTQVRWGYAPQTAPELPLVLHPYEAYSVIITIHATDYAKSQTFASPVSVTAVVGKDESSRRPQAVVTTDAQWTTGRVAIEPSSDAFRIDMSLREPTCRVGAPFNVSIRVLNLSDETRDLLLITPKAGDKADHSSEHEPVVSDVNGHTFGVWGLSGDESVPSSLNDGELLAVDAAIMLGEVKGLQSVAAEIRFVPLREGPLRVPDFKIYDKKEGKWYSCAHKLCVVATNDGPKD